MDDTVLTYMVTSDRKYTFLREVVKYEMGLSRSLLIKLKQQHKIMVNGEVTLTNYRLQLGDVVTVDIGLCEYSGIVPQRMPLDIVYEDDDFLLLNKPPHLPVHPSKGRSAGTLANAVTHYWEEQGKAYLFRPINRLDKDTSGLILIGKSQYAHQAVARQQKDGTIRREYQALVQGEIEQEQGMIDLPIALKDPDQRERVVDAAGKSACTYFTVIKRMPGLTLLAVTLGSGRTHQIRVHLSHLGYPIVGDTLYGTPSPLIDRQALHAGRLSFIQPRTGEVLSFHAPLPPDMQALLP